MENIAHTFFATALGQTGIKSISRLGMATLIISANFPDIDLLWSYYSDISYIVHHRGITHTFIGIIIQIFLISSFMYLYGKNQEKQKNYDDKVNFKSLILLSSLGLFSHLGLDFLNDYGIQPFYPFSDIKIQSATIFIIDLWFWIILGGFTFLTSSISKRLATLFSVFAFLSLSLVFLVPDVPNFSRFLYLFSIISLLLLKIKKINFNKKYLTYTTFSLFSIYLLSVYYVKSIAQESFVSQKESVLKNKENYYHLSPMPANIFSWKFYAKNDNQIFIGNTNVLSKTTRLINTYNKNLDDKYVIKALNTEVGKAFFNFTPYLFAYKKRENDCFRIHLRDARFIDLGENTWASRSVVFCD